MAFKWWLIGINRLKSVPRKHSNTITPPPLAWTDDTRQIGSMDSSCWLQTLALLSVCLSRSDSSDKAMSNFGGRCLLSFLLLADRRATQCGLDFGCILNYVLILTHSGHFSLTSLMKISWSDIVPWSELQRLHFSLFGWLKRNSPKVTGLHLLDFMDCIAATIG